jgi:hypothetical protein
MRAGRRCDSIRLENSCQRKESCILENEAKNVFGKPTGMECESPQKVPEKYLADLSFKFVSLLGHTCPIACVSYTDIYK